MMRFWCHHDASSLAVPFLNTPGSVVDKKQGWYRVQLAGVDGIKSFRWAELKEIESPASPSPASPTKGRSKKSPSSPSPSKRKSPSKSPAAAKEKTDDNLSPEIPEAIEPVIIAAAEEDEEEETEEEEKVVSEKGGIWSEAHALKKSGRS